MEELSKPDEFELRILAKIDRELAAMRDKRDIQRVVIRVRKAGSQGMRRTEMKSLFPSTPDRAKRRDAAINGAMAMGRIYKDGSRYYINEIADLWDREEGLL